MVRGTANPYFRAHSAKCCCCWVIWLLDPFTRSAAVFTPSVIYVQSQSWFPLPFPSTSALIYVVHTMPLESLWHSHHQKWVEMLLSQDDLVSFRVGQSWCHCSQWWNHQPGCDVATERRNEACPWKCRGIHSFVTFVALLGLVYFVCFLHCVWIHFHYGCWWGNSRSQNSSWWLEWYQEAFPIASSYFLSSGAVLDFFSPFIQWKFRKYFVWTKNHAGLSRCQSEWQVS